MLLLKHVFTLLHIITAAAWFGMALRIATQARAVIALERDAALALAGDVQRTVRFMGLFAVLTLVFAYTTFVVGSTLGRYGGQFHTAMLLIAILVGIHYLLVQPGWKKLHEAVAAGADAEGHRKRIAMGTGIGHLLWLVLLVLMFWDKIRAAL